MEAGDNLTRDRDHAVEVLDDYLDAITEILRANRGFAYNSIAELIKNEGTLLSGEPFTDREAAFLHDVFEFHHRRYRMRECYYNATELTMTAELVKMFGEGWDDMEVFYGEGTAYSGLIPCEHAVMVLNGKPVDVTWREDSNKGNYARGWRALLARANYCRANNAYRVLRFTTRELNRILSKRKCYGVLDMNRELIVNGLTAYRDSLANSA